MCAMLKLHTNLIAALVFHSPCLCTVTSGVSVGFRKAREHQPESR